MKKIDTMSAATNIKLESNTNHTDNIASNSANNPHNLTSNEKIAHYNNLIYSIDNSNDLFIKDKDSNTILIALSNYKCYIKTLQANSDAKNPVKPYTLKTTLKPNQIYSCFGIKLWQNIKTHKLQQAQSNKSKEIISIKFNGKTLQILEKGKTTQEFTFKAQSGDNVNKETMIEEGNYYIKANEVIEANIINNVNIDINQFNLGNKYIKLHKNITHKNTTHKETSNNNTANKNTSNKETSNKKTLKDDSLLTKALNLVKIQSTAYTIHGGKSYGDNKGIDLATQDLAFFEALQKLTNKYKVELENANNEIRVEVGYGKREIDLRVASGNKQGVEVKWISQEGIPNGCYDTCIAILLASNLKQGSGSRIHSYRIAEEKGLDLKQNLLGKVDKVAPILSGKQTSRIDGTFDTTKQTEYMKATNEIDKGIAYLDSELEKGYPVVVGVDHTYDARIKKEKQRYNDASNYTTDHFVVIVGRGYDEKGLYYRFYDVGAKKAEKSLGTNDNNKLHFINAFWQGETQIKRNRKNYILVEVRKNVH